MRDKLFHSLNQEEFKSFFKVKTQSNIFDCVSGINKTIYFLHYKSTEKNYTGITY